MDIERKQDECSDEELENWDNDCRIAIVNLENKTTIQGYHQISGTSNITLEPPSKQKKVSPSIRCNLTATKFVDNFEGSWRSSKKYVNNDVELIVDPFKVAVVNNLLEDNAILRNVLEEFNEMEWNKRSLDLYEFFQSADLKKIHSQYITLIYQFLKHDVKDWLQKITGLELTNISATCSLYGHTDYLLVHDDQQEDRLIAFVLYFTGPREWIAENGGALQLFSKDETGEPSAAVRDIFPRNNQFVFFQVTDDSYHQVAEVINRDDCRMSINGWFHTKTPPVFHTPLYVAPNYGLFSNSSISSKTLDLDLKSWIHTNYLNSATAASIQKQIEEESEISLHNFIKQEAWQHILEELQVNDLEWITAGPPNRRLYEVLPEENLPYILGKFLSLFCSTQMFDLLKQYTDLDLKTVRYELQRWKPGCYSLLSDYDWSSKSELDLILYLGLPQLSTPVVGGRTIYVEIEEEIQQALITLDVHDNHLNIVYRDSARITKYFSKCSLVQTFYLLICSYSE